MKPESSTQQEYYTVEKLSNNSCSCKVRCNRCGICICSYSCTSMDYLIHATICKHIHLVNIFDREQENDTESSGINSSTTTTSVAMLPDCNESNSIEHTNQVQHQLFHLLVSFLSHSHQLMCHHCST